ncbi:KU70 protein [Novymonas esmeraldas]|uniref:KU70 protein n=1 Tax=Novymonas esmeraldas TaxID=1808958 RepID=A0AAW0F2G9_9TRYP
MDEFAEWGENTTGYAAAGYADGAESGFEERSEQQWQRSQRDAVVCLVDCSESMFGLAPSSSSSSSPPGTAATVKRERLAADCSSLSDSAAAAVAAGGAAVSFFSATMRGILAFMQEKIMHNSKDVVAIVLYNTQASASSTGFRGVYVLQPATRIGTECTQRVEQLEAAGTPGTAAYEEFKTVVGHWPTTAAAAPPAATFKLSDALWEAQSILLTVRNAQAMRHRRIFVFTDCDDPSCGNAGERLQCRSRARDLGTEGVIMEVFGFGGAGAAADADRGGTSNASMTSIGAASQPHSASGSVGSLFAASGTRITSLDVSGAGSGAGVSRSDAPSPSAASFDGSAFWEPLLGVMCAAAEQHAVGRAAAGDPRNETAALGGGGGGAVHVSAGAGALQQLLNSVVRRVNPQRLYRRVLLRIGGVCGEGEGDGAAAATVPRMAVGMYMPLVQARPPQGEWLDERTNRLLRRVVRLHARTPASTTDGEEAAGQCEVPPSAVLHFAPVGGERVYLTSEERQKIVAVAAAGAEPGFTVLAFKDADAALRPEHVVRRCYALHGCVAPGGPPSPRLFTLLVRRLRAARKVAIAQYRSSAAAAPRLVALVPSPDLSTHPERRGLEPVEGLGLYVLPLPYAEELRAIPELSSCTPARRGVAAVVEGGPVDAAHRELAVQLVEALTVSYTADAVPNPVLQRQHRRLQELARRLFPLADNPLRPGAGMSSAVAGQDGAGDAAEAEAEVDNTVPDHDGMRRYAALFQSINSAVLGNDYDASDFCPKQPTATRHPRAGGSVVGAAAEEGERGATSIVQVVHDAAAHHTLEALTVPVLKEYLSAIGVSAGGARRKQDLLTLVQRHLPTPS